MKTLIKNAVIVTADSDNTILYNSNLVINNDKIESITSEMPNGDFDSVINANGNIVTPSFSNAHTHVSMTLLRNYADGYPLETWLNDYIFPIEDKLTAEDIYYGGMLGIMEMIAGGTTAFNDMYFEMPEIVRAVGESGVKAALGRGLTIFDDISPDKHPKIADAFALFDEYNDTFDGRVKINVAPHSVYTLTPAHLTYIAKKASEKNIQLHVHASETAFERKTCIEKYGKSPIALLDSCGIFDVPTIAAHCVHLDENDIEIMSRKKVVVAYNPTSNLKLGSGIADITALKTGGVAIALGTDGASSNNNLSMLDEINLSSILTNGAKQNPIAVTAYDAFRQGVRADLLGFLDSGIIAEGASADIVIWNTKSPHMMPMHNPLSAIVYCANDNDVTHVFCNGRLLYANGEFKTIDAEKIYAGVERSKNRLFA